MKCAEPSGGQGAERGIAGLCVCVLDQVAGRRAQDAIRQQLSTDFDHVAKHMDGVMDFDDPMRLFDETTRHETAPLRAEACRRGEGAGPMRGVRRMTVYGTPAREGAAASFLCLRRAGRRAPRPAGLTNCRKCRRMLADNHGT